MKKKLLALVLCLVLAFSLAACGGKNKKLLKDGVLAVGIEIGYPPFESYASDGVTPEGLDIDLAHAIGEKLGLEVEFIDTAFDTIFAGIGTNYDCVISAVTINDQRREEMAFSSPYIKNYQTVVVRADSDLVVTGFESLDGHSVSVQAGTTSNDYMTQFIDSGSLNSTLVPNEKVLTCFTQLENGEVDAVLCDSSVAQNYLAQNPDVYKVAWTQETDAEEFGVAVSKKNTELQSDISKAIDELEADGTLEEIRNKWLTPEE